MEVNVALVTARKRSLGKGHVFLPVCHSVHRGEVCLRGGVSASRGSAFGGSASMGARQTPRTTGYGQQAGGTHPIGMHPCFEMLCDFVL